MTQEGKGHGRGRVAEKTKGQKKDKRRQKDPRMECRNRKEKFGQDSNRMRIGHLDQTRAGKTLIPIGRKGNTHTNTTTT